ncbi:MAG: gliding motility-associated C-terminal domain-containing protein, partial [Bacteroidota bacterium]
MLTTTTLAAGDYRFTYTVGDGQVCPEDNAVVTIRLQAPPVLVDPGDLSACDSLELPIIVGSNLSADAAYFDQPNGQGTRFSAGSFIYNDIMLFLFDQNGDCSSEESINIQIGRSASAGDDNAVSICSGANVDLVTVLENADPGGTFSELDGTMRLNGTIVNTTGLSIGAYRFLYRVSGTAPCPDDEAILTINIQNAVDAGADNGVAICPGQSVDLETVLVGADPGGVFSDNNSTGGLTGSIFDASGLAAGIYTFTYTVGNGQNCSSDEAIISVQVNDPPQFVDPGDIAVCDFYVLPAIQGTNFNSAGYFDQPGGNGNVYAVGDTIRDFTVLYIYGQNGNCEGEAQFEVSFLEVPTINGLAVVCDLATGTYRVSFNINGGDIGTYTVTGNAGLLTNITFLSDPIAIGSPYLFNVQDGNNCGTVTVSDVPDCDCISDAGILAPASQRVCESSLATFIHSGPNLDGDDQLFFVLHDGSTAAIGNILAVSATPSFGFQTGMLYGQPYFVTAVVANSTSSGGIDFNDPCLSASEGVAVVFDPEISGRIEGDTTLCEGQDALIQFVLEGGSTFDAVLVSALGADTLRSIPNGHTLTVPGIAAVYTLVSLEVAGSACIAQLPSSSVEIVVNRLDVGLQVLSDYNGFAVSCPDAADGVLEATINGSGSSFNLQWNNGGSTAELNNLAEGNYVVTVTDDLGCSNVSNITLDAPPALDIFLQAQSPLCFGEAEGAIIIDSIQGGSGSYEYSLDGEQFTALTNYPFAIPFLAAGQYEVTILDANDCASVRNTVILEPPLAVVEIGDVRLVKFGERPQLNANLNFDPQTIQWLAEGDILIDCDTCLNTVVEPRTGGRLILLLTDENGCPASDTLNIVLDKTRDVFIPNVFSPNNDGFNDRFTVLANDSQVERVIQLRIYDRWGEVVYEAFNFPPNDNTFGWDGSLRGELLDPAVFVYFAEVEFVDGFREVFQGDLTLVR